MQSLDIISVNIWNILISLVNLYILYRIVRRFLFKPVQKVLDQRQQEIDDQYARAEKAEADAEESKKAWQARMDAAGREADELLHTASENARSAGDAMMKDARAKAEVIVRQAEEAARLERRKAEEGIRSELAGLSTALASKMIGREVREADHRAMIDEFIEELGDSGEQDQ